MATDDTTENTPEAAAAAAAAAKAGGGFLKAAGITAGLFLLMLTAQLAGPVIGCALLPGLTPGCQFAGETGAKGPGAKAKAPPVYFPMDPPMVVSFQDAGTIRFLQVAVELMARDEKVMEQVQTHMPVIRNNLLMLLGGQTLTTLTNRDDKEELRRQALAEVQRILKENATGTKEGPGIEDLYFTSFVVQ
jgi:flagellar FliL protein